MRNLLSFIPITFAALFMVSCANEKGRYVDLRTGENITVEKDAETGMWVNADTKKPVYIYVDTKNNDTIYGKTGVVINGHVRKSTDNVYWYDVDLDADTEYKTKSGDYKKEVEKDGDITIKDGDTKIKIDGETGEKKVKND
jgi:hypothetical protein